jgi:serine protease AprX
MNTSQITQTIKRIGAILLGLCLVFTWLAKPVHTAKPASSYIVQGINLDVTAGLVEKYGGSISSWLPVIHAVAAQLPRHSVSRLLNETAITQVVPNARVKLATGGDRFPFPDTDYPNVVGADLVWEAGIAGQDVTVAVIDTGLSRHPGLLMNMHGRARNRIAGWVDFVDGSRALIDPNGHGTHIAGIIANSQFGEDAEWNGVAPGVRLVGVRVLDAQGYGNYERVIQGIQWVITHKDQLDIKVINLSLVASVQSPYWADPLNQAVMQAWAQGITVVVSAGNGGPGAMTIGVPGNNPYVISVGAFTDNYTPYNWNDDYLTPFSAAGPTLDGFVKPDILAPGAHMVSTLLPNSSLAIEHPDNQIRRHYFSMAGTSQAAAVVSGIAALVISENPTFTPDQVKYQIMHTAFPWVDMNTTNAVYSLWQQGAGRVNAPDAVFNPSGGVANLGLDIQADLAGETHYEGFSYYDDTLGEFRLHGDFEDWAAGYGAWAGGYMPSTGGYGVWSDGYGAWAGGYGAWAGGYGAWAGGYGAWAGGYGAGAGGNGAWAGGYGAWAGGYETWPGGYGAWAGSYGDSAFADLFVNWQSEFGNWISNNPWTGNWIDFDG